MVENLLIAIQNLVTPMNLFLMIAGVIGGSLIGCLPGLSATMGVALLVPFTFVMPADEGLVLLGAIYMGSIFGGSISAILINTPGTPAAIATTLDGFPLTKKGKAESALIAAATASAIGGVVGSIALLLFTPPLAAAALKFGPPEYFWLSIFGLTIIASLISDGSIVLGLMGGLLGLLLSTIGIAPVGGAVRYTFGLWQLQIGVNIIVALIGFFCIPEVIKLVEKHSLKYEIPKYQTKKGAVKNAIMETLRLPGILMRSSLIGTFVGALPGAGGNVAGMLAYSEAKRWSKTPKLYGTGIIEGVAASESANNGAVGGSLIPLLALGIPGAPPAAVLLGALLMQGIRPGPELFTVHGAITYTFILSLIVASILLIPIGIYGGKLMARMISMPSSFLIPVITFLCVIGTFAVGNTYINVYIMTFFGLLGYVTGKMGIHAGPVVLGLILGPFAEQGLVQSMLMGKAAGSIWLIFFTRPISIILIILCIISAGWPLVVYLKERSSSAANKEVSS